MAGFRRICCPVDFSAPSRSALELGAGLARREGALLTVLHVTRSRWPGDQGIIVPGPEPEREEIEELGTWVADAERIAGGMVSSVLLSAPPAEAILGFAREDETDLLVMASHGRKGFRRLVLGSVAESVVRAAHCPVLIVRQDEPKQEAGDEATGGMPA
jgi:nucleotide-binding universal stress UspA family protein